MEAPEHKSQLRLFEGRRVRTVWDEDTQEWFFSVVDVVAVLTDQHDYLRSRKYWNKLKQRLLDEGFQLVTNCHQLKLVSPKDGKRYMTDVADMQGIILNKDNYITCKQHLKNFLARRRSIIFFRPIACVLWARMWIISMVW